MRKFGYISLLGVSAIFIVAGVNNETFNKAIAEEDVIISPVANYDFRINDSEEANIGRDSSNNGFNLKANTNKCYQEDVLAIENEDDINYLKILNHCGTANDGGKFLYAPQLGETKKDFSDLLTGSYTVSLRTRFNANHSDGSNYIVTFGRYEDCLTITPYDNGIEFQLYNSGVEGLDSDAEPGKREIENLRQFYSFNEHEDYNNKWVTITVVGNVTTKDVNVYLDDTNITSDLVYKTNPGKEFVPHKGVKISDTTGASGAPYTFAIGAQSTYDGMTPMQYGSADYQFIKIFDCPLSEENVNRIVNDETPTISHESSSTKDAVIKNVEVDTTSLDLEITDVNKIETIITKLPSTVNLSVEGKEEKVAADVMWYPSQLEPNVILGILNKEGYFNLNNHKATIECKYVITFTYNSSLIKISNITIDGNEATEKSEIEINKDYEVKFKVTSLDSSQPLSNALYDGVDYKSIMDASGFITINVNKNKGANINLATKLKKGIITYIFTYDDTEYELGSYFYTSKGREGLCPLMDIKQEIDALELGSFNVLGLYSDEELSELFTSDMLNYSNPTDLTLYVKAELQKDEEKSGCGGSIETTITISIICIGAIVGLSYLKFINKEKHHVQ